MKNVFSKEVIHVVGGGLAGSECAYQLARRGHLVCLHEMRQGGTFTPAHKTRDFAELVCSNSFGSQTDYSAPGQLKWEAERLDSLILKSARKASIPAGMALGVDRKIFSQEVTKALKSFPNIQFKSDPVFSLDDIPRPAVIATGPLTHESLALSIQEHLKEEEEEHFLYFYDAIAPVIDADSIDMSIAWKANRYDDINKDYINCPLSKEEYFLLVEEIKNAQKVAPKEFEDIPCFEGCMPVENFVERGPLTLRFGPLSPKGLKNPKTGKTPFAVVQLRQENKEATAYNMVGFQTKMKYGEQIRVFRKIPGLQEAEFLKLGSIHKNLYIHTPKKLTQSLSSPRDPFLFFAGQITGVEGYFESTCIGLLVALFLDASLSGKKLSPPPRETAIGALLNALIEEKEYFQPTNINFGLFPRISMDQKRINKKKKRELILRRAQSYFEKWMEESVGLKSNVRDLSLCQENGIKRSFLK
ncbi:MAG: methylenetetrahydrofolate--tRNA-(uracil(54)-C(5))-methyltransferase (FADH(2)-oxidizing) TrmFO [Bdellovibrio sp.]|nr:MAG: methylenetetrahydrofolate--tRNA-(uracil(54)-C(5))-methyltransferase (FADH(2)-oxidizing) TrmFO [Bdellovibrio sp.]